MLFFSNNCEGSKQLLSMLQSEKLIRFFHLICTDNNPKIPPQIKVTPTLIIRGVTTPYVAGDCFIWFAKVKQWKINIMMQKMTSSQQQYLQNVNHNLVNNDLNILGFNKFEMSGMSDFFSFYSRNMEQECQEAFPQSYFKCDNIGDDKIFTPPLEDGSYKLTDGAKYKITQSQQKELQTKLEMDRKKQDELFKQNIDNFKKQYCVQKN